MRPHLRRDIARVLSQNPDLGAGRIVFRQTADLLEQGGAARVVEEFARDRLAGAAEPIEHGIAEAFLAGCQIMKGKARAVDHPISSANRNPTKAQRAEGGKKLR
jgi:hypothetical protein